MNQNSDRKNFLKNGHTSNRNLSKTFVNDNSDDVEKPLVCFIFIFNV